MVNFSFWRSPEEQPVLKGYSLNAAGAAGRNGVGFMSASFESITALQAVERECGRLGLNPRPSHVFGATAS